MLIFVYIFQSYVHTQLSGDLCSAINSFFLFAIYHFQT